MTLNDVSWLCQSNAGDGYHQFKRRSQVPIRNQLWSNWPAAKPYCRAVWSSIKLIRSKKNHQQGYYEKIYRDIQPTLSSIERKALEIATSHAPCLFLVDYSTVEGGAFRTQQTWRILWCHLYEIRMADEENANKMYLSSKLYHRTRALVSPGWFHHSTS